MGKIYRKNCEWCKKWYESWAKRFCGNSCASFYKHSIKDFGFKKGIPSWITGKKLDKPVWNKGLKGVMKPNKTSFKIGGDPWNKGKTRPEFSGYKHPMWKQGKTTTKQGYISLWTAPKERVLEHRYTVEQSLGRKLKTNEHVHHINGNKIDNRIENLRLLTHSEHNRLHAIERWKFKGSLRNR